MLLTGFSLLLDIISLNFEAYSMLLLNSFIFIFFYLYQLEIDVYSLLLVPTKIFHRCATPGNANTCFVEACPEFCQLK